MTAVALDDLNYSEDESYTVYGIELGMDLSEAIDTLPSDFEESYIEDEMLYDYVFPEIDMCFFLQKGMK